MDRRRELAKLLHGLANVLESASEGELDELLSGRGSLRRLTSRLSQQNRRSSGSANTKRDWIQIAEELTNLPSREDGHRLLNSLNLSRSELEKLARAMGFPVSKQDNTDRLREKIVEFGIGARLGSRAIRGEERS